MAVCSSGWSNGKKGLHEGSAVLFERADSRRKPVQRQLSAAMRNHLGVSVCARCSTEGVRRVAVIEVVEPELSAGRLRRRRGGKGSLVIGPKNFSWNANSPTRLEPPAPFLIRTRLWLLLSAGIDIASSAHIVLFENMLARWQLLEKMTPAKKLQRFTRGCAMAQTARMARRKDRKGI